MIRKKHRTLCFSLFLALSMVLTQLIPVAATDEVPTEEPAPVTEQTVPAAEEPAQDPDPEPTVEDAPADDGQTVTPSEGEPVEPQPEEERVQPEEPTEPSQDGEEVKVEEEGIQEYTAEADGVKVKAIAAKGALPEGAILKAARLNPDSPEYKKAADTLDSQQVEYTGFVAMDIHFEVEGQEVEPAADKGGVQVELKVDKKELPAENAEEAMQTLEVQHHEEQGTAVTAVPVAKAAESTVREEGQEVKADFSVDNFSTFTITWNWQSEGNWWPPSTSGTCIQITVHPLGENGVELQKFSGNLSTTNNSETYTMKDISPDIDGYAYSHAFYKVENGNKEFKTITFKNSRGSRSVELDTSLKTTISVNQEETKYIDVYLQYESKTPGYGVIKFHANGGDIAAPESQTGELRSTITMPDYTGSKLGYSFVGWAENPTTSSTTCFPVYPPGSEYEIDSSKTLYAVWNENTTDTGHFFIRKDGKIPTEPGQYGAASYTDAISISNAVKNYYWTTDSSSDNLVIEGNHAVNKVTQQLIKLPTDEDIRKVLPGFDSSTQYVLWYVQKYASNSWHIDGVVLDRTLVNVTYLPNCNDPVTVPTGYQVNPGMEINVGSSLSPDGSVVTPVRNDYTFLGWNTKADGTGISLTENSKYLITENTTFYAQWSRGTVLFILKHTVSGNMADQNKYFEFFLDVKDHNKDPITTDIEDLKYDATIGKHTVSLKHDGSVRVNLPIGSTVAVSQAQEADYSTTHGSPSASDLGLEHSAITLDADINTNTVHFNNHKEAQVPTGMNDQNNALHGVVLSAGVVLILVGVIVALRRRMNAV